MLTLDDSPAIGDTAGPDWEHYITRVLPGTTNADLPLGHPAVAADFAEWLDYIEDEMAAEAALYEDDREPDDVWYEPTDRDVWDDMPWAV